MTTLRALAVMFLLPPVALFGLAWLLPGLLSEVGILLLVIFATAGLAVVATSNWPRRVRIGVGAAYVVFSLTVLPFLGLMAVCSTGDCL